MFENKKERIYKHQYLDTRIVDRYKPLMESAFRSELSAYDNRPDLKAEKLRFITEQYANRVRVSKAQGLNPLNEDAAIFGSVNPQMKNLFESVSDPGNIINMGNVRGAMDVPGDNGMSIWNPAYKPGTGDIPSYVFGLQNQLALHCIGFDLLPTIAVDTPNPVVIYIDTVYGGGALDSKELPSYIEVFHQAITRDVVINNKMKRGSDVIVLTLSSGESMRIRFMVASTVSTSMTVEVLNTNKIGGVTTNISSAYSDDITVKEFCDASALLDTGDSATLSLYADDKATTVKYPAQTIILGTTPDFTSLELKATYASATRTNITQAATNNNSLKGMSRAEHEKGPKYKLNVIAFDKKVEIDGFEIEADTTNIQIRDLAAMGVNVISYLYTGVQNQLVQSLDEVILDHLYKLGIKHAADVKYTQGIDYNLFIDNAGTPSLNVASLNLDLIDIAGNDRTTDFGTVGNASLSTAYENQITHNERLYRRLLLVSEFIKNQTRIGQADSVVLSGELAAAVKAHSTFTISPTVNTLRENNDSLSYYGSLFGLNIYKNGKVPFNDPRVLVLRRGNDTDTGAKFLAYDLASSVQIKAEQTMSDKIRVFSRFAIADVGFYPELNYFTFIAYNKTMFV